jgi:hypothetical protein
MMINWVRVDEANRLRHDKLPRKLIKRGILSRVRLPMHTGQLEGINNRIKVKKRAPTKRPISRKAHNKFS